MFILLADDDIDDCNFFEEAIQDLPLHATLSTVNNGVALMKILSNHSIPLPDVLFLDLNMPLKTGFECLSEIKMIKRLRHLPIIIFSTSLNINTMNLLYENGAHFYIRKPGEFAKLKSVIHKVIALTLQAKAVQPHRENFLVQP